MQSYEMHSDIELYSLLQSNDVAVRDASFREIYKRNSSRVFVYCRRILGEKAIADDAFQETFSLFFKASSVEREITNLPAYILRIARNVCLRMRERQQAHPTASFDESLFHHKETHSVETAELAKLIALALDLLPEDQREALVMQAYNDLSYQEIADIMNVPVTSVRNWIARGKKKLRDTLTPYWSDYQE